MLKQCYRKIINVASMLSFFGGFTVPAYEHPRAPLPSLRKLCPTNGLLEVLM
nr:hypothetical protein [Anaerotignum propionicum]